MHPSSHAAYAELLKLFADDLGRQSLNAPLDIKDNGHNSVLRIPFWAWAKQQPPVHKALHPYRRDSEFEWVWALLSDRLPVCQDLNTADAIDITPPCPPIEKVSSLHEADRRLYLTATLADDSVLVTHFDTDPSSIANSIVPDSTTDLGDRLVLAPTEVHERQISLTWAWCR